MDIKKQFEAAICEKSVKDFFTELQKEETVFHHFDSLQEFIEFMASRASCKAQLQDFCLLAIVRKIQSTEVQEGGLNLLTYLLAPGLQRILRDIFISAHGLSENWLNLWWEFFQSIQRYPLSRRRRNVATNILFDTRHRIRDKQKVENFWQNIIEPIGDHDWETEEDEPSSYSQLASALIEGTDEAGLNEVDMDLVISSRVYDESMKSIAKRLGLDYHNALKRRYRAEKRIESHWRRNIDKDCQKKSD